jgi:hypothetical protein
MLLIISKFEFRKLNRCLHSDDRTIYDCGYRASGKDVKIYSSNLSSNLSAMRQYCLYVIDNA